MRPVLVKHIMTSRVTKFFEEQTLPLAADVMRLKHIRHLPVVDEIGHVVGVVTHRDLLRAQISPLTGLSDDECRARQAEVTVGQIMTRDVWTVRATSLASTAGTLMLDHGFGCLPVVDGGGYLIGIVTAHDYLRFAIKSLRINDPEEHVRATTQTVSLRAAAVSSGMKCAPSGVGIECPPLPRAGRRSHGSSH